MDNEVFKVNPFLAIILPLLITVGILIVFFVADVPPWILVLLIVPIIFAVTGQKNKLIIRDGILRYEKLFGTQETSLHNVTQIVLREVETIVDKDPSQRDRNKHQSVGSVNQERKVEMIFYVLDESGRTIFSFPANLISIRDKRRFEEAVSAINSNIEFS